MGFGALELLLHFTQGKLTTGNTRSICVLLTRIAINGVLMTIQPELERFVAKRLEATVFETASSHVPMLSQPEFVLDVIRRAAAAVAENGLALALSKRSH
jgi:hypothetical protein